MECCMVLLQCLFLCTFVFWCIHFYLSSAPEFSTVWNPSLRKTMSQPAPQTEHDSSAGTGKVNGQLHKASTIPCSSNTTTATISASPDAIPPITSTQRNHCSCGDTSPDAYVMGANARMHSPAKNRLNLFEGFRNTLRSRAKSEVPFSGRSECDWNCRSMGSNSEDNKNSMRRWSETGSPHLVRWQQQHLVHAHMAETTFDPP